VFNGYESACTASVVIYTFSVKLTGQTNSRAVFSRKYYNMYYYYYRNILKRHMV